VPVADVLAAGAMVSAVALWALALHLLVPGG
jgi:hypothetical protein